MASSIDICNLALSLIGKGSIASFNDASLRKEARECRIHYEPARDATLRDHEWGFASRQDALVEVSDTSVTGWDYVYIYPSTCLCARRIYGLASSDPIPFSEGLSSDLNTKYILTNEGSAELSYTARVTNTEVFDSLFVTMLAYRLAAELAGPLRGDPNLAKWARQVYEIERMRAQSADANESREAPSTRSSFLSARA